MTTDDLAYKRRIKAWTMYDWANSAFATTILAAVLPIYYSQVAGATLSSPAKATAYWSLGISISLLLAAVLSPILGTISDVMRGKKRFLALFMGIGAISTGMLVLVDTGDWLLASLLFILAKLGFNGANVFYDALLPHVARQEDVDTVSTRGYAMGYLGGGLLLLINVMMIQFLPGTWGPRLSFLSVGIWWALFSIPIFRHVPEPMTATATLVKGLKTITTSFRQIWDTIKDIRRYRQLFKYLIAYLIYIDGIGTIISVAAIYGAELGFDSVKLILALLLVQFVGIPFSLIFGRLPNKNAKRRPQFLAFIVFNLISLPLVGILGARLLPEAISGKRPLPYTPTATAAGEGLYQAADSRIQSSGDWRTVTVDARLLDSEADVNYFTSQTPGARLDFTFNGQEVVLLHSTGPDHGTWQVLLDGQPLLDEQSQPVVINARTATPRYDISRSFIATQPGEHTLSLVSTVAGDASQGTRISLHSLEVLPAHPAGSLGIIIALIAAVELLGLVFAWLLGKSLFSRLAEKIDTQRGILLALLIYAIIAVWGFFLDSVIEFWFLAWMVAVVQGGSQALSRSLFASMSPATKSGEFFGLFGIMEKFSSFLGPIVFAWAAATFDSSRPAVLSLILFFVVGGFLLTRVNVVEGRQVAREEDAQAVVS